MAGNNFEVGNGVLKMVPGFDEFVPKLKAGLESINEELTVKVNADLSRLRRELRSETQVLERSSEIRVRVGANTLAGARQLQEWRRREQANSVDQDVDVDTGRGSARLAEWRASEEGRAVRQRVEVDRASLETASSQVSSHSRSMSRNMMLKLSIAGLVGSIGLFGQLAASASTAAGEILKAGQALAALPAVGFAGLAGAATVAVGATGFKDYFSAATSKTANPVTAGKQQASALNAVENAQYGLRDAQKKLNEAQREGARNLRDLNNEFLDQKLAVEDASLSVEEAQQRLNEVLNDPTADSTTRKRADLSYRQAMQRLTEQQNKTQDMQADTDRANAAGVQGSQEVLDAVRAVTVAQQQLNEAQTQVGAAGGQDKIAAALAKLSPNARSTVESIRALGPAWKDLRMQVQDNLFERVGGTITELADKQLPNLKTGLSGIATEMNIGLRSSLGYLSSAKAQADFSTSLENTRLGFAGLARAAAPATMAVTQLITTGSAFLPRFGDAIDDAAGKFNNFIARKANSGELYDFIDEGIDKSKLLGTSIVNVAQAFGSVFRAASVGSSGLQGFADLTDRLEKFLGSVRGQDILTTYFANARAEFAQWKPVFEQIPPILKAVVDGTQAWARILTPFLSAAGDLINDHTGLVKAAVIAYLGFKTVGPILAGVQAGMARLAATQAGVAASARASIAASAAAGAAGASAVERQAAGTLAASGRMTQLRAAGAGALGILGNPWILGMAAAGAATVGFISSIDEANEVQRNYANRAVQVQEANAQTVKALRDSGGAVNENVLDAQSQRVEQFKRQLSDVSKEAPGFWDKIVGTTVSAFGVDTKLDFREGMANQADAIKAAMEKTGLTNDQFAAGITGTDEKFQEFFNTLDDGKPGISNFQRTVSDLRFEFEQNQKSATEQIAESYRNLGKDAGSAADDIDKLTNAIAAQDKQKNAVDNARLGAAQSLANLTQGVDDVSGIRLDSTGSIDLSNFNDTSAQALVQNLQGAQVGYSKAVAGAKAWAEQNKLSQQQISEAVQKASDDFTNATRQQLINLGLPGPLVDALLAKYNLVPGQKTTKFEATGIDEATSKVNLYKNAIAGVRTDLSTKFVIDLVKGNVSTTNIPNNSNTGSPGIDLLGTLSGRATGGFLPTTGPGTDRTDGILAMTASGQPVAMVDGGEHITRRDMSQKYSRELTAINNGTFPKFAGGGVLPSGSYGMQSDGSGAFPDWVNALGTQYAVKPSTYAGHQTSDRNEAGYAPNPQGLNRGIDWGGTVPAMQTFAEAMFQRAPSDTAIEQIIWQNPTTGQKIGWHGRSPDTDGSYYASDYPGHQNHVHLRVSSQIGQQAVNPGVDPATGALNNTTTTISQQVTYAQAPLPGVMSEDEINKLQGQASVDSANQERNKVYADPASTAADKQAADLKYFQAQNSLQAQSKNKDSDASKLSVTGMFEKAGGILGNAVLGFFGLENSILAEGNVYNKAINDSVDAYNKYGKPTAQGGGYAYTPKNNPAVVTSTISTPSPAGTAIPSAGSAAAGTATTSGGVPVPAYNPAGGVEQWRPTFAAVLQALGQPASLLGPGLAQMQTESGGNPKAINMTDSNAAKGTPSKGLMQVIDPTFAAYRAPQFPNDIWEPSANIAAAIQYGVKTYPDLQSRWGSGVGYANGGKIKGPGGPKADQVPIWASNDEFMVNAASAKAAGPLLDAINSNPSTAGSLSQGLIDTVAGAGSLGIGAGAAAANAAAPGSGAAVQAIGDYVAGGLKVGADTLNRGLTGLRSTTAQSLGLDGSATSFMSGRETAGLAASSGGSSMVYTPSATATTPSRGGVTNNNQFTGVSPREMIQEWENYTARQGFGNLVNHY